MVRYLSIFFLAALGTLIIDQNIKIAFVDGFYWDSQCFSLELHYNKGVAFSMLAFLGENLKWLQVLLVGAIMLYIFTSGLLRQHSFALGLLIGGAVSNLYDRFVHGGVVDYFAWHCWFEYAVFNFADVVIDLAVVYIIIVSLFGKEDPNAETK